MNKQTKAALTYRDEVMIWGNMDPWKTLDVGLKHRVEFTDADVTRDGKGNITDMPLLPGKPCFGRPEVFFRHGKRTRKQRLRDGRIIDSKNHQCGRCPSGVWDSCGRTAMERVNSDPRIRKAFDEWRNECKANHNGAFVCVGTASWPWGRFKAAIAARGPFDNSNDEVLRQLEKSKSDDRRRTWCARQQRRREKQRAQKQASMELPSRQLIINVRDERDLRKAILLGVLGQPGQPRSRRQVLTEHVAATATIMANAWAIGEIMRAAGVSPRPGSIARVMHKHRLGMGLDYPTLNARLKNDLKRVDGCEADGVWEAFDPDLDLETCFDDEDNDEVVDDNLDSIADLDEAWEELCTPDDYAGAEPPITNPL